MSGTTADKSVEWTSFRQAMPVAQTWAYYDHAAVGPLAQPARQAMTDWARQAAEQGDVCWPEWSKKLAGVRRQTAEGLNASSDEIAFVANTSDGISLVANGISWESGDNVVLPAGEFPSNYYPWKALESRGVELRVVSTDELGRFSPTDIRKACDDRTRLVAASWVGFASGYRCDVAGIAQVAKQVGAYFFLDAIQGLGVFPLDLSEIPIDFLAADGHKWILAPEGFGVLYVRRSVLEQLTPTRYGWHSVKQTFDYHDLKLDLKPNAQRFEAGSHNMVCAQAFGASLELLASQGWGPNSNRLGQRVIDNRAQIAEVVRELGGELYSDLAEESASGILSFGWPSRDPVELRRELMDRGIVLSCRNGRLRVSAHGYNDESDLERLRESLLELLA